MSRSSKGKKSKIPKLTEAEYAEYISSLKSAAEPIQAPKTANESAPSLIKKTDSE